MIWFLRTFFFGLAFAAFSSQGFAQSEAKPTPTVQDLLDAVVATGWTEPPHLHPLVKKYIRTDAGPKLEPLIQQFHENITVDMKYTYGAGNTSQTYRPYDTKKLLLHKMGGNKEAPVDAAMTLWELLEALDPPEIRKATLVVTVPRNPDGTKPKLTIKRGRDVHDVSLLFLGEGHSSETLTLEGLSYEDFETLQVDGEIINIQSLYQF